MKLADFLSAFLNRLNKVGIAHCVLRNYDGLPEENLGNDIDLLVRPNDLEAVISILIGIKQITITGMLRRSYVVSFFISGVDWGVAHHAIQVDLVFLLGWKGVPYLSVDQVLAHAQKITGSGGFLKKPAPCHEALISFFSSYLVGGWIKEKYQPMVKEIFYKKKQEVLALLCDLMPQKTATTLMDAVIDDDRKHILALLPSIKCHLLRTSLSRRPLYSVRAIVAHFFVELKIRYTPYPIDTICFLGPDGSGKSSVISGVICKLKYTTKEVVCYHLKPTLRKKKGRASLVANPHAKPPRSAILSFGKIIFWLLLYWYDRIFHGHKNLTLRIWDRYYDDLLIDPKRYRYGAPMWLAKTVGMFIPAPDIVILLDAPSKVLQDRKQEVSYEETKRQRDAYLKHVQESNNAVVIDASQPLAEVVQATTTVILNFLAQRVKNRY